MCAYQAPARAEVHDDDGRARRKRGTGSHIAKCGAGDHPPHRARRRGRDVHPRPGLSKSVADRRFTLILLGIFAVMALLLAATGVYSVLSQAVAKRTQEIGIRMALGAEPQRVVRLMLGSALTPVAAGIVAGATGAIFGVRFLSTLLFGSASRPARLCRGHARHRRRRAARRLHSRATRDARRSAAGADGMDSDGYPVPRDAGIQRAAFGFHRVPDSASRQ